MSVLLTSIIVFFIILAAVVLTIKLFKNYMKVRLRNAMIEKFPGNPAHFLWGNLLEYPGPNEEGLKFQRDATLIFPRLARAWLGPVLPMIMLVHPETVKMILRTSEPKALRTYRFLEPWIGDGLLLSGGEKWRRNRRLLTPAFHFDILKPYQRLNNQIADVLLKKLSDFCDKDEYFEVFSEISMYTLDVITQCAFSYKTECQIVGEQHPYIRAISELVDLATERFFKPWLHVDLIYFLTRDGRRFKRNCDYVHKVAEEMIIKRQKELNEKDSGDTKRHLDFLDILLKAQDENGEGLSNLEIRNEVDTFMFEGHDTTASAISWTLFSIAENKSIQKRLQSEIDQVLEGRESDEILWEDLPNLPYLTMCVKEGMRCHCPVPFIQRETTQELEIDGLVIPPGTMVNVIIYNIHHNAQVWEDSTTFDPDRFLPENVEKRDPYAFVPFSAGPRNCIGQHFAMHEMKTVIARILRRFDLSLDPNHIVKKKETLVMRSEDGIFMKASPRK